MQTVSSTFDSLAKGYVRPISYAVKAAFEKQIDPGITFFTLDTSLLDGVDILAPDDNNVVTEWDKYLYTDYSSRVISIEVSREQTEPFSIVQSFADVTFNNFDKFFTPNSGSPIENYILPRRPFRILMGFGGEVIQTFVGLSTGMPTINRSDRTASFHLIDFLSFIFDKDVPESAMLLNQSTSEILAVLFGAIGLTSDQYSLDPSFNRIPFFYVEKGRKLGDVIKDLMIAEQGRLYLDELGIIRFKNRENYDDAPVYSFSERTSIDYSVSDEDDIINYVKLEANILGEQIEQSVWEQSQPVYLNIGDSVEIWANLSDPVSSALTPIYSSTPISQSHFISSEDKDGTIPYTGITLTDI